MFNRFTDRARKVLILAQQEAARYGHGYIGTEHLLLGLLREGEGVAAKALNSLGLQVEAVQMQVESILGKGQDQSSDIGYTPRAKKVIELAMEEALRLGHSYVGTEHILLGLIREGEGIAAQVLIGMGVDINLMRQRVIEMLGGIPCPAWPRNQRQKRLAVSRLQRMEPRFWMNLAVISIKCPRKGKLIR